VVVEAPLEVAASTAAEEEGSAVDVERMAVVAWGSGLVSEWEFQVTDPASPMSWMQSLLWSCS